MDTGWLTRVGGRLIFNTSNGRKKKTCRLKKKGLSVFGSPQSSLKSYHENVQTTWRLLSASSCPFIQPETKRCPRTPTAELHKGRSHNWPAERGDVTHRLRATHSSKWMSDTTWRDRVLFLKKGAGSGLLPQRTITRVCNTRPWESPSGESDDCPSRSCPGRIIVPKQSAAKLWFRSTSGSCF